MNVARAANVVARWLARASRSTAVKLLKAYADDPSSSNKAELSDWGINIFREGARKRDYDRAEMSAIMREEAIRIRRGGFGPDESGLNGYLKVNRAGSMFQLSRAMRAGLFCQLVANGLIR